MDGMEATKIIRELGYECPIVALTANAVSGQADMFLKNGFDAYISKPIDIRQLNTVLNKLIRDKQPPEVIQAARQSKQKKSQTSNNAPQSVIDPQLAKIFVHDASKALVILEPIMENTDYAHEESMRAYIINVHGMKSALSVIGNTDLSATAGKLEMAGREGNLKIIASETPAFVRALRNFVTELTPHEEHVDGEMSDEDESRLRENLSIIREACENYDEITADAAIKELNKTTWPKPVQKLLNEIAEYLLHSDYDEIVAVIDKTVNRNGM